MSCKSKQSKQNPKDDAEKFWSHLCDGAYPPHCMESGRYQRMQRDGHVFFEGKQWPLWHGIAGCGVFHALLFV